MCSTTTCPRCRDLRPPHWPHVPVPTALQSASAPGGKGISGRDRKLNRRQIPVVSGHPWDGVPALSRLRPGAGQKPKAEAEQPEKPVKAEKPAKAEKAAKAEKPAAPKEKAAAKQAPRIPKEGTSMEENQKRTSGGRSENRRSNNSRTRRGQCPSTNRGSNASPNSTPLCERPEATPAPGQKGSGCAACRKADCSGPERPASARRSACPCRAAHRPQ